MNKNYHDFRTLEFKSDEELKRIIKDTGVIALFGDGCLFSASLMMSNKSWFKYNWTWCKNIKTGFLSAKYQPLKSVETISIFYKKSGQYYPQMVGNEKHKSHHGNQQGDQGEVYGSINLRDVNELEGYHPTNIIKDIKMNASGRLHPSEKPVALLEYLIKTYTTEGMVVLDNCMGSGSTGVACINTNRDFIRNRNEYRILQNSKKEIRYGYF